MDRASMKLRGHQRSLVGINESLWASTNHCGHQRSLDGINKASRVSTKFLDINEGSSP
jgi:hypothetical protein